MSAQFIWVEANEFSNKTVDKYDQVLWMVRRLLTPTVAAVNGSDLVCNYLTLHLAIHMKIQNKTLPGQSENPALCLRKKRFACKGSAGAGCRTGTESARCPVLMGKRMEREDTFNLKWEGK